MALPQVSGDGLEKISAYQKTTKTGKVVDVREHVRGNNEEASDAARRTPDRPPIAASLGTFAGGRSIPGLWLPPKVIKPMPVLKPLTPPTEAKNPLTHETQTTVKKVEKAISEQKRTS